MKKISKKTTKKVVKKVTAKTVAPKVVVEAPKKRGRPSKKVEVATEAILAVLPEDKTPFYYEPAPVSKSPLNLLPDTAQLKASYDANGTFLDQEVPPMTVSEEKQLEEYLENLKKDRLVLANSNKSWLTKVWEFLANLFSGNDSLFRP